MVWTLTSRKYINDRHSLHMKINSLNLGRYALFLGLLFFTHAISGQNAKVQVSDEKLRSITSDSPKLLLGPETLVSSNSDGGVLRCEPSAAIYKNTILVAWNDSYGGKHGSQTGVAIGWAISSDGGKTFKFGGYLPEQKPNVAPSGADSWLATDSNGDFYLQVLSWQEKTHHIQIYFMPHDKPGKWEKLPDAVFSDVAAGGETLDKPAMAVSNDGKIGIVYTALKGENSIKFVLSENRGKNWAKPVQVSSASKSLKTGSSVAMIGKQVVASWMEGGGLTLSEAWSAISNDGGKTFDAPTLIYKLKEPLQPPKGYALGVGPAAFISNNTWLANTQNKNGKENFYLTLTEGAGDLSKILLFQMTAGATKWSSPTELVAKSRNSLKLFPSIAIIEGKPAALYYYRENPASTLTDVYVSIWEDKSNFQNIKLNSASSDWAKVPGDKEYAPVQRNFGDYITLASDNRTLVAVWTDGRDGRARIYSRVLEIR